MPELDKTAPEATPKADGNAEVATPAPGAAATVEETKETKNQDKGKGDNELEELTYKERFGNSTKEALRLLEENKKMRAKLGLGDTDPIEDQPAEEKPTADSKEENPDDKKEEAPAKPAESTEETPAAPAPEVSANIGDQTAFEVVWDNFAEKNPALNKPEIADRVAKEIKRFSLDTDGNKVSYKIALKEAFDYVYNPIKMKEIAENSRAQGVADATKNRLGTETETTTGKPVPSSTKSLTEEERETARKMGMSDEEYLKNKAVED